MEWSGVEWSGVEWSGVSERDHALARKVAAASKRQEEAHEDRVVGLLAKAGPGDEPWVRKHARP